MGLKFRCVLMCVFIFNLSSELKADPIYLTVYQRLIEFAVDGIPSAINDTNWSPSGTLSGNISQNARLIAMRAQNDGIRSCGGIIASTESNSIITDRQFKCVTSYYPGWMTLGYDDSKWTQAIEYEDNMAGRINCSQNYPIIFVNPSAKWIWSVRDVDTVVYCRGYARIGETTMLTSATSVDRMTTNSVTTNPVPPVLTNATNVDPMTTNSMTTNPVPPVLTNATNVDQMTTYPMTANTAPSTPSNVPCAEYLFINMADGSRSSDYDSSYSTIALCDAYAINNGTWYRFEHLSGSRLINKPISPWRCGTEAPIWLNGEHPTEDAIEKTVTACATYDSNRTCQWSGSVRIRRCSMFGETFYVYLLPAPPGCPLSYCVDAASRRNCTAPEIWITGEHRCGVPATVPTTTPAIPTATAFAPTTTFSPDGWSNWEHWSQCSSTCDYGLQTRRRICEQSRLPCKGPSTMSQPCKQTCPSNVTETREQNEGIVLILGSSDKGKDTLSLVILNQDIIYEQLRVSLNRICSQNASLCCGSNYAGNAIREAEFVILGDVYQVPGSLHNVSDRNVSMQIVAVVGENVEKTLCRSNSQSIASRRKRAVSKRFLSFATLLSAIVDAAKSILTNTGLDVLETQRPKNGTDSSDDSTGGCPVSTCVVPLVISILGIVGIISGTIGLIVKHCCGDDDPGK